MNFNFANFISSLFEIRIIGHIAHLQTTSYSQHIALNELYTGIVDFTDRLVETYQGLYPIVKGYPAFKIVEGQDMVVYLKGKINTCMEARNGVKDECIKAIIDELMEFLANINYKLSKLK